MTKCFKCKCYISPLDPSLKIEDFHSLTNCEKCGNPDAINLDVLTFCAKCSVPLRAIIYKTIE